MASPIEATVLLCDAAQADPSGKLHMLGAGWSITSSPTAPSAVAVLLQIPWDRANQKLRIQLQLENADGDHVEGAPSLVDGSIEVGRPPGVPPGSPIDAAFQVTVPPLPLQPGRYVWRLHIAEQQFSARFLVRETPPPYEPSGGVTQRLHPLAHALPPTRPGAQQLGRA